MDRRPRGRTIEIMPMDDMFQTAGDVVDIVADILDGMSFREKTIIANVEEREVPSFVETFDRIAGDDPEMSRTIVKLLWKVLHQTHRVRRVK